MLLLAHLLMDYQAPSTGSVPPHVADPAGHYLGGGGVSGNVKSECRMPPAMDSKEAKSKGMLWVLKLEA